MTAAERGLLPARPDVETDPTDPAVVPLERGSAVVDALAASTTRAVLGALYDEPAPASEVADRLDLTIQNASYHLSKLESAGLVDVVGRWYSEKGRRMRVYAPSVDPLVVVAGRPSDVRAVEEVVEGVVETGEDDGHRREARRTVRRDDGGVG